MMKHIIQQDWWLVRTNPLNKIILLLLVLFMAIAAWNGKTFYEERLKTHHAIMEYEQERFDKLRKDIRGIEEAGGVFVGSPFQDPRGASNVAGRYAGRFMLYPFQPISSWVVGQSDLYPHYYRITASKKAALILNDEIENPQVLFSGSFDLAFVIIYLLPLLIIAFTYNIAASERELGTVRLLMSEPVSLRRILTTKFAFRFALFTTGFLACLLLCAAIGNIPLNETFFTFLLASLVWVLFWFGLSLLANALINKSSGSTAATLVSVWMLFVLFIPGLFNYIVNTTYPAPSRINLITETREAAEEVKKRSSQVLAKYLEDHPELAKDTTGINPNDFATKSYTSLMETERMTAPLEKEFTHQLKKQNDWVRRFQFLSPAVVIQENLNRIAATDERSYQYFSQQADSFYRSIQKYYTQRIVKKRNFSSVEVAALPKPSTLRIDSTISSLALVYLLVLTVLCIVAGWIALRKFKPV